MKNARRLCHPDPEHRSLAVARRNAARLGARITFIECDVLDGFDGRADVIVSNPPYVPDSEKARLQPEVGRYEPNAALFGGDDGLAVIRRLFVTAPSRLAEDGRLVVEFGFGQDAGIRALAESTGWRVARIRDDLQGIPRTAVLRR